jgi:hypothetical protein
MSWRKTLPAPENVIAAGDTLLVVDTDDPLCRPVRLICRKDHSAAEHWFWERPYQGRLSSSHAHLNLYDKWKAAIKNHLQATTIFPETVTKDHEHELCTFGADAMLGKGLACTDSHAFGNATSVVPVFDDTNDEPVFLSTDLAPIDADIRKDVGKRLHGIIRGYLDDSDVIAQQPKGGGHAVHCLLTGSLFDQTELASELKNRMSGEWPCISVHVHPSPSDGAVEGAMVFLKRHADGLPTWRDLIPNLALTAKDPKGEEIRLDILPESASVEGLCPGQTVRHRVTRGFQLPPHCTEIRLPLSTKESGGEPMLTTARISHAAFPLSKSVDVNLEVHFHYVREAFKIAVLPSSPAPFDRIDIHWIRGDEHPKNTVPKSSSNTPPAFPDPKPWHEVIQPGAVEQIENALRRTSDAVDVITNKQAMADLVARMNKKNGQQARGEMLENLERVLRHLRALDDALKTGVKGDIGQKNCPPDMRDLTRRLNDMLAIGGKLEGAPQSLPKKLIKRARRDDNIGSKIAEIQVRSWMASSRLKSLAHPQLSIALSERLDDKQNNQRRLTQELQCYGRVVGFSKNHDTATGFAQLVAIGETALADNRPVLVRDALWALATASWTSATLIPELQPETAEGALRLVRRVFDRLASDPAMKSRVNVFEEAGLLLMALLRMRNTLNDAMVRTGNKTMEYLADQAESIDRFIAADGRGIVDWRIKLKNGSQAGLREGLSPLADELIANLRGERTAVIIALNDVGD